MKNFKTSVLKKIMTDDAYNALELEYKAATEKKKRTVRTKSVTDVEIFKDYMNGMSMSAMKKKYGMSEWKIKSAIVVAVK